jgi:2',3'-cyclic-nucleotide 2'-phosphodiesterase
MELIFLGDIIGIKALEAAIHFIQTNNERASVDFKIANAENVSGGFGLSYDHYTKLINGGFDLLTGGNHIWDKKDIFHYINGSKIVRPCNYPKGAPGNGWQIINKNNIKLGVINVMGRVFMNITALDCPFRACDKAIEELNAHKVDAILIDVHAEASSEKIALAHYLDGRVAAVVGTHTHVQTADERILPKGTAFITDAGPCVPQESIIGMKIEGILQRFLTGLPNKAEVAEGQIKINGVKITFDERFKPISIRRLL